MKKIFVSKKFLRSKKGTGLLLLVGIPVVVGITSLAYQYYLSQNPQVIYARKLQTITQQVGKSISLPKNENPITATVSDVTKLPNEAFFKKAQNGDKVLMYKKNKLAILYRPGTGQVIAWATLDFQNVTPTSIPSNRSGSGTAVAGASTSAVISPTTAPVQSSTQKAYIPQGKILVAPQN